MSEKVERRKDSAGEASKAGDANARRNARRRYREALRRKKAESCRHRETLLSRSIGLLPLFSPCIQPAPLYRGVRLRSEHLPPSFLLFSLLHHDTTNHSRLPLFVQSCARNIAATGRPRPLQRAKIEGKKRKRKGVTLALLMRALIARRLSTNPTAFAHVKLRLHKSQNAGRKRRRKMIYQLTQGDT